VDEALFYLQSLPQVSGPVLLTWSFLRRSEHLTHEPSRKIGLLGAVAVLLPYKWRRIPA